MFQVALMAMLLMMALTGVYFSKHLSLIYADIGFSPAHYVYKVAHLENFARDFPSGVENFDKSSVMNLYKYAYSIFGIQPLTLNRIFIFLEVISMSIALCFFSRAAEPNRSYLGQLLLISFFMAGEIRDINIANFGGVLFYGHYYIAADILNLLAVIFLLRGKLILSVVALAFLLTVHPVQGVFLGALLGSIILYHPREYLATKRIIIAGIAGACIAVPWILTKYNILSVLGEVAGHPQGVMSAQTWMTFARFGNYHFFVTDFGSRFVINALIPYLLYFSLWVAYRRQYYQGNRVVRKLFPATVIIFIISLLGLLIPHVTNSPFLVKISLHRISNLFILVTLPFMVQRFIFNILKGSWVEQVSTILLIVGSFLRPIGVVFSLPLIIMSFGYPFWQNNPMLSKRIAWHPNFVVVMLSTFLPILTFIWLSFVGYWPSYLKKNTIAQRARDYEAAQLWIKSNTAPDALIMPPPNARSAGQGVMVRSSFGTLRDWIHNCCLYNSSKKWFDVGLQRSAEFGVNLQPYINKKGGGGIYRQIDFSKAITDRYHTARPQWYRNLAKKYGIDYMIFLRKDLEAEVPSEMVYANDSYIIFMTSKIDPGS